jgi:ABC-type spermidine/putrescine transport system permease subunit I
MRAAWALLLLPALLVFGVFATAFVMFADVSFITFTPGSANLSGPATLANYRRVLASSLVHDAAGWQDLVGIVAG